MAARIRRVLGVCASIVLVALCGASTGQGIAGSLSGKLTDLRSSPLSGVRVVVRNLKTGVRASTTTQRNGAYRFAGLEPGEYVLVAEAADLRQGTLGGILVNAGHEAHVQAAIGLVPVAATNVFAEPQWSAAKDRPLKVPRDRAVDTDLRGSAGGPRTATRAAIETVHEDPPAEAIAFEQAVGFSADGQMIRNERSASTDPSPRPIQALSPNRRSAPLVFTAAASQPPVFLAEADLLNLSLVPVRMSTQRPSTSLSAKLIATRSVALTLHAAIESAVLASVAEGRVRIEELFEPSAEHIEGFQIARLPLGNLGWADVAQPAASEGRAENDTNDQAEVKPRDASAVSFDGANTRLAFGRSGMSSSRMRSASLIGPGATETILREVDLVTTAADAGSTHSSGGGIRVQSERGGDTFHAKASLFSRENLWSAQNPFTQWVRQTAPSTATTIPAFTPEPYSPSDQALRWSVAAGGRVRASRFYWYGAIDDLHRSDPAVSTVRHPENFFAQPSNDQMQVLSARLGLSNANPIGEGIVAYSGILQALDDLLGPASRSLTQENVFGRADWARSPRWHFVLEGTQAMHNAPGGGFSRASETYGTHSFGSSHITEQWLLAQSHAALSDHVSLSLQGSFGHHVYSSPSSAPSSFEQSLIANTWNRLPQITIDTRDGFKIGNPARFGPGSYPAEHLYGVRGELSWRVHAMELSAGLELSHNNDSTTFLRNQTGTYTYSSVENFASDALAFAAFGIAGQLSPQGPHNCDQTGKVWRDTGGTLRGLGSLPCYSSYTQTIGPSAWWLSSNDWAGFVNGQWHPAKQLTLAAGLRWEFEQAPPPIGLVHNADLPVAGTLPSFGSEWAPRAGLSWGNRRDHWPVVHLGYELNFARTPNSTLETVLTHTGSAKGDLNVFLRPTDNLALGGAPPFPYVLAGMPGSFIKPDVATFSPSFRNGNAHQFVAEVEETLPGNVHVAAAAVASLGRKLPVTLDTNIDPAVNPKTITYAIVDGNATGPIRAPQIALPFYAMWPAVGSAAASTGRINSGYQQILEMQSRANSTYEAAVFRLTRNSVRGFSIHARYTYGHAADWNPDDSTTLINPSVFDPSAFSQEYGTSDLDIRHSASASVIWASRWKLHSLAGRIANSWSLAGLGNFRGGTPYSMRTSGTLAKEFDVYGDPIVGLAYGINGYGGENRMFGVGRNTFRYPSAWKADLRLAKRFDLGEMRRVELLAESFNLFNHRNVTELETVGYSIESGNSEGGLPTLTYLTGLKSGTTEFGQPLNANATDYYRPRQIQFGLKMSF